MPRRRIPDGGKCALQLFTIAFMSATLFVKTRLSRQNVTEGQRYLSYLFFASFFFVVNGFSELPLTVWLQSAAGQLPSGFEVP